MQKSKFSQLLWTLVLFTVVTSSKASAQWSQPPLTIYPPSPPYNSSTPYVATDDHGNCIAVWYEVTHNHFSTSTLMAATLASGDTNNQGQPNWVLTQPIATDVKDYVAPFTQAVGMDASGNATVVWTENDNNVYASKLPLGHTVWSQKVLLNNKIDHEVVTSPSLSVAKNGNAVVAWTSAPHVYTYYIFANSYDASTDSWRTPPTEPIEPDLSNSYGITALSTDPQGNAVMVVSASFDSVPIYSFNFVSNTWTIVEPFVTNRNAISSVAVDSSGNAIILSILEDSKVVANRLLFGHSTLSDQTTLSTKAKLSDFFFPSVSFDSNDNAIAGWSNSKGGLAFSKYTSDSNSWTPLPSLKIPKQKVFDYSLFVDGRGNALISLTAIGNGTTANLCATTLTANSSTWAPAILLSKSTFNLFSQSIITATGNGVVVWESLQRNTEEKGRIVSSQNLTLFTLAPPRNFSGRAVNNKFLMQTDRINELTWLASTDTSVVTYKLYRNNVFLAQIKAEGTSYSYADHNRNKNVTDTYSLTAVNRQGKESPPVYVTIE